MMSYVRSTAFGHSAYGKNCITRIRPIGLVLAQEVHPNRGARASPEPSSQAGTSSFLKIN